MVAGMGVPPAPQGAPLAQQVMARAQQPTGVEGLPSNLPQSYAPGGLVAFADGGEVERYQSGGSFFDMFRRRQAAPDLGPVPGSREGDVMDGRPGSIGAFPADDFVSIPRTQAASQTVAAPVIKRPSITLPTVDVGEPPALADYTSIIGDLPKKAQDASEKAVKATQEQLEAFDKPVFERGESRLKAREAELKRDTDIGRWSALLKGALKTMGGTSKFAGVNIAGGAAEGVDELIKGEAANRASKERLADAQDNFDMRQAAAKKGNYQAAQAAGQRAADDLRQATQLTLTATHYGNNEAQARWHSMTQAKIGAAQLQQQGQLGIAGLDLDAQRVGLQAQQLANTINYQNKVLAQNDRRIASADKALQVRYAQVKAGAAAKFDSGPGMQLSMQLAAQYGNNWRTGTDARSLQAQMLYRQARQAAILDATGAFENLDSGGGGARSAESLLGGD